MAPHGFQHGPLGALRTGSGSPVFPTALDVLQLEDGVHAPMPSFPLGSPAFPPHDLCEDDDHVLVTDTQLAALREAVPSPSPSHFTASPTTFAAIEQAMPAVPMDTDTRSPRHSEGSRTPKRSASVLPTLQIPWSSTQVQTAPVPTPPSREPTVEVSATALGPPADYSAGSPGASQPITRGTRIGDVDVPMLQPALDRGDRKSCPIELSSSPEVTHAASYRSPHPTPEHASLLTQEANARDRALMSLVECPQLDNVVFLATDVSEECLADINLARVGYANYLLDEPLSIHDATDIVTDPAVVRQAADIVIGTLSVGPMDSGGSETDLYRCLSPSSWFRLATAVLAGLTRGAVRTTMLRARGDFPFRPCLDSIALPAGVPEPATQSDAIRLLLTQLTNEFDICRGASGLTDEEMTRLDQCRWPLFARELRARLRDDTFALTEKVSYYNLAQLADAVHREATEDELKRIIRDDRLEQIRGSAPFNMELRMLEQRERERAELELKANIQLAAHREFSSLEQAAKEQAAAMAEASKAEHLLFLLSDYKAAAETKARAEADEYYSTRLATLKAQWDLRVLGDERALIREAAIKLGLFPAAPSASPATPKRQRTAPLSQTAAIACATPNQTSALSDKRRASTELAREAPAPSPHPPTPSTPTPILTAPTQAPLDPQTRGVASSMHNPANRMTDDLPPFTMAFTQNADDGAAPLSQTPSPEHTPPPPDALTLILERIQTLEDRFDQKLTAVNVEVARLTRKVDTPPPPARPAPSIPTHVARPTSTAAATRRPNVVPDAPVATRPTPESSDAFQPTGHSTRQPDAPAVDVSPPRIDDNDAFPPLDSAPRWSRPKVTFAQATSAARHITQSAAHAQRSAKAKVLQVQKATNTTYTGRPRGQPSNVVHRPNTTEITVLRDSGFDDEAQEATFRARHKADIVREIQRLFTSKLAKPPKILEGRFTRSVANTGNFVLVLSGLLAGHVILSLTSLIQSVFGPKSSLCPVQGFTWMQIRDVPVRDENGVALSDALHAELVANPPFDTAWISVYPHYQVDPDSTDRDRATVLFAFVDDDKKLAERTALAGLCMFGERAKVVISGNKPSLIQCGRCFGVTHRSNRCPLLKDGKFKCVRCTGPHHSFDHDRLCKAKTHTNAEVCDCKPKCRLCNQVGHDAVSRRCPMRGDFGPPKLVLPPNLDQSDPPAAPAHPSDAPSRPGSPSRLHSRVRARPAWKGKEVDTSCPPIPIPPAEPAYLDHMRMLSDMPTDTLREYLRTSLNDPTDESELGLQFEQTLLELAAFRAESDVPMDTDAATSGPLPSTSQNPPL